jgi:predicted DCC family thiol-disulfide oxidoreductase YuxK
VLLYDGGCGFCTRSVEAAIDRLPADVAYEPFQTADLAGLGVSEAEAAHAVLFVDRSGRIARGPDAAARLLVAARGGWAVLGHVLLAPPVSWLAEVVYAVVSRVRQRLPGVTPALDRPPDQRPGHRP